MKKKIFLKDVYHIWAKLLGHVTKTIWMNVRFLAQKRLQMKLGFNN